MPTTANETPAIIDQQKDLAHLNETVEEIKGLKESYKDLQIEGPDDTEGYEQVRLAIGVLRPKRTGLDRERKDVVRPYNEFVKHINSKYDEITTLIQDGPGGELELKEKKEAVDAVIREQKEAEDRAAEEKINARINELLKHMEFDGSYYSISAPDLGIPETSIGVVDIRTMSDDLYQNFLQMVSDKAAKITAEKERVAELERKAAADKEAADKAEREEFDRKKKEFDDQQAAFKKQQDDLKAQQDKLDKDKREAEQREQQTEQNRINEIIRHRSAVLTSAELTYNPQTESYDYDGEVLVADAAGIADLDDVQWIDLLDKLKAVISGKKFAAEEFLKKQKADDEKKKADAEEERLAGLSDKQKMQEYIDALYNVPVPPLKTKTWKAKAAMVRDMIADNRPV